MSKQGNASVGGLGLAGTLTVLFVALKLIPMGNGKHVIDWSWWWVLSPIWISWALALVLIIFAIAIYAIVERMDK